MGLKKQNNHNMASEIYFIGKIYKTLHASDVTSCHYPAISHPKNKKIMYMTALHSNILFQLYLRIRAQLEDI